MQLPRRKCMSIKLTNAIRSIQIKREKGSTEVTDNISCKIVDYIEKHQNHYYKDADGREMVEIHVDNLYTYNNDDKNLPVLPPLSGNLSVLPPNGARPRIVLG